MAVWILLLALMYKRLNMANGSYVVKIGECKSRATSVPLVDSSITEHVYRTIITARTAAQKWTEVITMTDRERLIDLMIDAKRTEPETGSFTEYLADYLLEHGVIVPPCKVGDKVYRPSDCLGVVQFVIISFNIYESEMFFTDDSENIIYLSDIGKTVFLTREEADEH